MNESSNKQSIFTKCVHSAAEPESVTGAVMPPIFQTSTYVQSSPGEHKGYDYSRADNPTRERYERALASLEGVEYGLSFSSGLAAEQAVIQLLNPGAHVLVCDDVYGGTGRLFRSLFAKYGIEFSFVDMNDDEALQGASQGRVDLIWVESPTNPTMKIIDLGKIGQLAREKSSLFVVDNTFASPVYQNPHEFGADVIIHSTTKYIGGHSDVIGGALMTNDKELFEKLKFIQFAAGAVPGPFECFLLLRSLRTLAIRMERHQKNALKVVEYLMKHPMVDKVFFPGHESHPHYRLANKQMRGSSGMLSFDLHGDFSKVKIFTQSLKLFTLAESLGGVESLINHPQTMTHASVPEKLRERLGIGATLLRLSVGIEDACDLVDDLDQAFARVSSSLS